MNTQTMNWPTVQDVVDAYRKTGLIAETGVYCEYRHGAYCGCGIGALALAAGVEPDDDIDFWADNNFGLAFSSGFTTGFDGEAPNSTTYRDYAGYTEGYAVGRAAALAVGLP